MEWFLDSVLGRFPNLLSWLVDGFVWRLWIAPFLGYVASVLVGAAPFKLWAIASSGAMAAVAMAIRFGNRRTARDLQAEKDRIDRINIDYARQRSLENERADQTARDAAEAERRYRELEARDSTT
jgi:hypothetical protein